MNDLNIKKSFLFFVYLTSVSIAQLEDEKILPRNENWFMSSSYGLQISGIKSEDFINSNVTPAFTIDLGKWISKEIALQLGFKGFYFNTISDSDRHPYNFIYGNVLFNINKIFLGGFTNSEFFELILYPGAGYFYNHYYDQPNICANVGIKNNFKISNRIDFSVDISGILGWDIYQGNEDILPSINFGAIYSFK